MGTDGASLAPIPRGHLVMATCSRPTRLCSPLLGFALVLAGCAPKVVYVTHQDLVYQHRDEVKVPNRPAPAQGQVEFRVVLRSIPWDENHRVGIEKQEPTLVLAEAAGRLQRYQAPSELVLKQKVQFENLKTETVTNRVSEKLKPGECSINLSLEGNCTQETVTEFITERGDVHPSTSAITVPLSTLQDMAKRSGLALYFNQEGREIVQDGQVATFPTGGGFSTSLIVRVQVVGP